MGIQLTEEQKFWLRIIGYTGGTLIMCYALYHWFAAIIGKEVATALIKAGVVAIA